MSGELGSLGAWEKFAGSRLAFIVCPGLKASGEMPVYILYDGSIVKTVDI